jgi:hypothetical protein
MDVSFCVSALEEALARFGRPEIFNTDQGELGAGHRRRRRFDAAYRCEPSPTGKTAAGLLRGVSLRAQGGDADLSISIGFGTFPAFVFPASDSCCRDNQS